jgi:hypothetical protein
MAGMGPAPKPAEQRGPRTTIPGPPLEGGTPLGGGGTRPGDVVATRRDLSTRRPHRRAWKGLIRMGVCPKMPTADCCRCEHGLAAQQISVSRER